jgi:hypothetical protein
VTAPFDRFPDRETIVDYTDELCRNRLDRLLTATGPVNPASPVVSAWWQESDRDNGNHGVGCYFGGSGWTVDGALPEVILRYDMPVGSSIAVSEPDHFDLGSLPTVPFMQANVDVQVTVEWVNGTTGEYGIACRHDEASGDMYALTVHSGGTYRIRRRVNGTAVYAAASGSVPAEVSVGSAAVTVSGHVLPAGQ